MSDQVLGTNAEIRTRTFALNRIEYLESGFAYLLPDVSGSGRVFVPPLAVAIIQCPIIVPINPSGLLMFVVLRFIDFCVFRDQQYSLFYL